MGDLALDFQTPRTAAEFESAGVVFRLHGGRVRVLGLPDREDLQAAIRQEVNRRAALLKAQITTRPIPPLRIVADPSHSYGACRCCGEPLPKYRGGDCALCVLAFERAVAS